MAIDHLPWPASAEAIARDRELVREFGSGPFALVTLALIWFDCGVFTPFEFTHRFLTRESRAQFKDVALRNGIRIVREFEEE